MNQVRTRLQTALASVWGPCKLHQGAQSWRQGFFDAMLGFFWDDQDKSVTTERGIFFPSRYMAGQAHIVAEKFKDRQKIGDYFGRAGCLCSLNVELKLPWKYALNVTLRSYIKASRSVSTEKLTLPVDRLVVGLRSGCSKGKANVSINSSSADRLLWTRRSYTCEHQNPLKAAPTSAVYLRDSI